MNILRWLLPALLLAGCAAAPALPTTTSPPESLPNSTTIPLEGGSAASPPTPALEVEDINKAIDRSRYWMDVSLNYDRRRIQVQQVVDYLNQSATDLDELVFVVEAEGLGGQIAISRIAIGDNGVQDATLEGDLVRLPLPEPLPAGKRLRVSLDYELWLPNREGALGYSARQQNWADWYPFVPPYQAGEGWLLRRAGVVGEHLVYESADFTVRIRVEDRHDVLIAAPAPPFLEGDAYQYSLENARRFAWSASPEFVVLEGNAGNIPVQVYVFGGHEQAGAAALETAGQALEIFADLYGEYPYDSLSIIEADFPDGMESDGLFWLYNGYFEGFTGNPQNYLTALTAHEIAHNWWFGQVGNDAALEPWLDEALCTYSELLFYQHQYPALIAWWWRFRILDYSPVGAVNSSIYDHEGFAPYVQAVYLRGALFLDALRTEIGDDAFSAFLADYAQRGQEQILGASDFFTLLAEHSDVDLQPLLNEYFEGAND